MCSSPILATWNAAPKVDGIVRVSPDGCRDLILQINPGARPVWFISALEDHTLSVRVSSGVRFVGLRLQPGMLLEEEPLITAIKGRDLEPDRVVALICDYTRSSSQLEEMLACLAEASSVAEAATWLGVTPRTLQRLVMAHTGQSPGYWLRLARMRRAARAVLALEEGGRTSLAAIAADHLYADQAHMTRDFRKWLGISPAALRADAEMAAQLQESGYG